MERLIKILIGVTLICLASAMPSKNLETKRSDSFQSIVECILQGDPTVDCGEFEPTFEGVCGYGLSARQCAACDRYGVSYEDCGGCIAKEESWSDCLTTIRCRQQGLNLDPCKKCIENEIDWKDCKECGVYGIDPAKCMKCKKNDIHLTGCKVCADLDLDIDMECSKFIASDSYPFYLHYRRSVKEKRGGKTIRQEEKLELD